MNEELRAALAELSSARKANPGLERIGAVMPHVDRVVGLFNQIVISENADHIADANETEVGKPVDDKVANLTEQLLASVGH